MAHLAPAVTAFCVAALYYGWREYHTLHLKHREKTLRERVAYLLWVVANGGTRATAE